jgi:hypothetical protein
MIKRDGDQISSRDWNKWQESADSEYLCERLAAAEEQVKRLEGLACLICGRGEPCELKDHKNSPCTFDPNPVDAARAFLARAEAAERARGGAQEAWRKSVRIVVAQRNDYQRRAHGAERWSIYADKLTGANQRIADLTAALRVFGYDADGEWHAEPCAADCDAGGVIGVARCRQARAALSGKGERRWTLEGVIGLFERWVDESGDDETFSDWLRAQEGS